MEKITGTELTRDLTPDKLRKAAGSDVCINACVHKLGRLGGARLVLLRTGRYIFQSVCTKDLESDTICEGAYVRVKGIVNDEPRAPYGFEIELKSIELLSLSSAKAPLRVSDRVLESTLETNIEQRSVSLRHPLARAVMRISSGIEQGFAEFMRGSGFIGIHTPKICLPVSSHDRNLFRLRYFDTDARLSSSQEIYKQICIGFFDRVYEIGTVFRAEKHCSARHLCEYTELDLEQGFIRSMRDIMQTLTAALRNITEVLWRDCDHELDLLGISVPGITDIPSVTFYEALEILGKERTQYDLDPTDEVRLCEYSKEHYGSELIFVTHFPQEKRPFFIMDSENGLTESFDLLFRGMKIASGGQNIHDHNKLREKAESFSLNTEALRTFLDAHKYGLPPHGGAAMGLERLVMKLCGLENIREASLFPLDMHRLF